MMNNSIQTYGFVNESDVRIIPDIANVITGVNNGR